MPQTMTLPLPPFTDFLRTLGSVFPQFDDEHNVSRWTQINETFKWAIPAAVLNWLPIEILHIILSFMVDQPFWRTRMN